VIQGEPALWERRGERVLVSTRVLELRNVRYRHPKRGTEREFLVAHAPDWVNVIARTPEGRIVLVRQFRFGSNALSLEVPGGVMEAGEDPVGAGVRELLEETGYGGGRARLLGSVHPNPAIMDNRCHVVLVDGAVPTGPIDWDDDEEIQVSTASAEEALEWARSGRIVHSLSIAALFLFEGVGRV
jgi:8-oxo-dGTP pyrophosphatase MutT (NUDIX family)